MAATAHTTISTLTSSGPDREVSLRPTEVVRDAVECLDEAALEQRVSGLADRLARTGVCATHSVGICIGRRLDAIVAILACRQVGAAYVPLDADFPLSRLAVMVDAARPALVIVDTDQRNMFPATIPQLQLCDESIAPTSIAANAGRSEEPLAYVLFTSGSTGVPKGVAMRASVVDRLIDWHVAHPRLGRAARTLQFAPLGFDVSYQEIFVTRATAGTLIIPTDAERRDPYALLDLLAREKIERLFLPYVGLQALAEAVAAGGALPARLRDVVTAGEQLRVTPALRTLFAALPGAVLHNHYGPTETHVVTACELSGDPSNWPELPSIGQSLPHVRVLLVDGQLNPVRDGDEGELLLGGDCLAAGYANAPELTDERFIERDRTRWYRSGDRVRRDADGDLHYLGRLDQQIKLDGFRVEPAEIEIVLGRHPGVAEAVVVATTSAASNQLIAHLVARDDRADIAALIESVREHAAQHLAPYLLPSQFHIHAALPLTASGKIDRRALVSASEQRPLAWPDNATLEEQVSTMWQQLLDVEPIGQHDNLFDHGARSLTVVHALTHLRQHGHVLSAAQVYECPTIAGQLALLEHRGQADNAVAAAGARGERQRDALSRFGPRGGSR